MYAFSLEELVVATKALVAISESNKVAPVVSSEMGVVPRLVVSESDGAIVVPVSAVLVFD